MQLNESELRCAIDGDEHVEPALLGVNSGNVDVELADWIGFEFLAGGLVASDVGKSGCRAAGGQDERVRVEWSAAT
ncbi:hypothetical protein [Halotalea alkalilenta]|uniref:hypothetical protein n=1 Tax=Halotalea alkalilenta TaxID=376489 RepID=UPI0012DF3C33|nr:hypothetical protein [Halotalea alkalilenta]